MEHDTVHHRYPCKLTWSLVTSAITTTSLTMHSVNFLAAIVITFPILGKDTAAIHDKTTVLLHFCVAKEADNIDSDVTKGFGRLKKYCIKQFRFLVLVKSYSTMEC